MNHILIRTDASSKIGTGHVMRCLSLAEAAREQGARVAFVCRELPGNRIEFIRQKGFKVHVLPGGERGPVEGPPEHAAWLGVNWRVDAVETARVIEGLGGKPDLLVADHYALDRRWEEMLRHDVGKILVIDDLADREHDCDFLLDQNLPGDFEGRYESLVPKTCRLLLGPEFALLRSEFAEARAGLKDRDGRVEKVLVFFGSTDVGGVTSRALSALDGAELQARADVVTGAQCSWRGELESKFGGNGRIEFLGAVEDMASLMSEADLALGGAGTTTWERLCLGLPAILGAVAFNQERIGKAVHHAGAAIYLGPAEDVSADDFREVLDALYANPDTLRSMSRKGMALVDGKGAERVVKSISNS